MSAKRRMTWQTSLVLVTIAEMKREHTNSNELRKLTGLPASTVSRALQFMRDNGWIEVQLETPTERRRTPRAGRPPRRYHQVTKAGWGRMTEAAVRVKMCASDNLD